MREIKFKAYWEGNWYFSDSHKDAKLLGIKLGESIVAKFFNHFFGYPTLCQFTGLKDKNGVDIYDGDIVNVIGKPYKSIEPIIVEWGKRCFGWVIKFNCGKHYEKNPMIKYYSLPSSKNIEVIGNIHENKVVGNV